MNISALKSFAPAVRRQLMEAVDRKLDVVLAAQTPDYRTTFAAQVAELRKRAEADRAGLIESVAYTWFNRLTALRYLDARGWHPFRARVLTPATPDETQPELLKLVARTGSLPEDLQRHTDAARLDDLLDGRIPSADPQGEVYRHLVLAACRFYHALLPDLFERLDDATELLLPDDLLTEHSVAHGFRTQIGDEDCAEVEIIGWLYQFYIAEKKDAVMARKSAVPGEDIPAVTQLFTPHWIVRYLVENSLGRLWLLNRPGSRLRERMPYYIGGEAETDFLKITRPEELRIIDPAVGSGHMLTYAFDLLYAIYEEEGYAPSEIPGLILKHNLYGVDIDPRAAQLAMLALVLKAREKGRQFLQRERFVRPNVIALQDVRFEERELREYVRAMDLGALFDEPVMELLQQFEHATTFGSLIQPVLGDQDIQALRRRIEAKELGGELFLSETHQKVLRVLEQAEYLTQRYYVMVANPPYMGSGNFDTTLRTALAEHFKVTRTDLYAIFLERSFGFSLGGGFVAMVTMQSWMFTTSYRQLRETLLIKYRIENMIHLGTRAFGSISGEVVSTTAFVMVNVSPTTRSTGKYLRLVEGAEAEKHARLLKPDLVHRVKQAMFSGVPGSPLIYWKGTQVVDLFQKLPSIGEIAPFREGIHTGDNARFLRFWWEVPWKRIILNATRKEAIDSAGAKWVPYNKGGEFTRWFGNNHVVIAFDQYARDEMAKIRGHVRPSQSLYFQAGGTWADVGSRGLGMKYYPEGYLFDGAGPVVVGGDDNPLLIGGVNSSAFGYLCELLMPNIHYKCGTVKQVPFPSDVDRATATRLSEEAIQLARTDWDNLEISWDFQAMPLLRLRVNGSALVDRWNVWKAHCDAAIRRMQGLDEHNNRLWISAYGLQDELSPDVPEDQITLARADRRKDMAAFLSYAVGCMMGRYSLDAPSLILADAGDTVANYVARVGKPLDQLTFAPDQDGIIPVLDGEWFEDDVVARTREFLRATFGDATLRENLRFIEESLGKEIRKYFLTDFYKDHLQTYKKRPIYWLVQSPRKGFSALIYLHRYTRDTMNIVLNRYLREYQAKLRDRLAHLAREQANPALSARDTTAARKEADRLSRVLHECEEWERDTLLPLAQARIELDLDDGVKVNYLKLGQALAPIPGLAAKSED